MRQSVQELAEKYQNNLFAIAFHICKNKEDAEDGTVWVYYYDQKLDITEKFEDEFCYVKLHHGEKTLYVTVKYQDGYGVSEDKYPSPSEWDTDVPEE